MIFMFIRFVLSAFLIWMVCKEAGPWTGLCFLLVFIRGELENFLSSLKEKNHDK
jgi:hypothetical protein